MAVLSQYDYLFAIGTLFALLDAYNNGASKILLRPFSSVL
jgi:solute carrier family 20 (sodium-dependent phosphate transporter)